MLKRAVIFFLLSRSLFSLSLFGQAGMVFAQAPVRFTPENSIDIREDVTDTKKSDPIEMFRGWSLLYKGYPRSPIAFDSINDGKKRMYPSLAFSQNELQDTAERQDSQRNSMKIYNLGVDDEIHKTKMAIYQPFSVLQDDLARDPEGRDRHLALFKTLRGIAILTLSYLDKTVAAGLATTQQQMDNATTNHMLKQIAWASSKMANPNRSQLYVDTDEKLEACLHYSSAAARTATKRISMNPRCSASCLDLKYPTPTRMSQGLFSYCVCCAETETGVNNTWKIEGITTGLKSGFFSLVERIFFGQELPKTPANLNGALNKRDYIVKVMQNFREMYGDIVYAPCGTATYNATPGNPDVPDSSTCDESVGGTKFEYQFPYYSIADKVRLFRDGTNGCDSTGSASAIACPITGTLVKEGICPAIKEILGMWPPSPKNPDPRLRELWVQASLGKLLTAEDVNNMFMQMNLMPGELKGKIPNPKTWEPKDRFKRWLDSYCDASAIAAFKRYHYRMAALVEDHITLNQFAADYDKAKLRDLMGRVTRDIELLERDTDANAVADRQIAGLNIESDRNKEAELGATAHAATAGIDRTNKFGTTTAFGNVGQFVNPASAPSPAE